MRAPISHDLPRPTVRALFLTAALSALAISTTAGGQTPPQAAGMDPPPAAAAPTETAHRFHETRAERSHETIDQRISGLHAALRITPAEESDWKTVAQVMRWNQASMEKLVVARREERRTHGQESMTALEEMKAYEAFNRAHLDGLKDLIASFSKLYNAMPASQKLRADHVFQTFGHGEMKSRG